VEGGGNAKLCADKNNHSGQTWISIYVSPLSESPCKLLNRVVPNGTLRGVEGEVKISPIRLSREKEIFVDCTEEYKEHIEYTFNAFCRSVIRYAAHPCPVAGVCGENRNP
jgi:hypothetical protein